MLDRRGALAVRQVVRYTHRDEPTGKRSMDDVIGILPAMADDDLAGIVARAIEEARDKGLTTLARPSTRLGPSWPCGRT